MIKLYLVRHGESAHNLENRIQGQSDSPLTPLGIRQAEVVAVRLAVEHFDAVYSSDLGRALQTAEIIAAPHHLPVQATSLLRERDFGVVQGMTRAEIEERFPSDRFEWRRSPSGTAPPDAETHPLVVERCGRFISQVLQDQPLGSCVLAICHGGSLSGLILSALGLPVSAYRMLHFSNVGISILEIGDAPSLRCLNDTCHLANVEVTDEDADNAAG